MISERTFRTLELAKVLERLAANASFSLSREAALALRPASELSTVQELQHQTAECVRLLDMGVDVSMGGAHDIRPAVTRAERGGALDPAQLLDVRSTLDCAERIARTLGRLDESYPWLQAQRHRMGHFRGIINAITGAINDRGEVMDAASPALQRIRSELRVTHTRLVDRLNAMLASAQYRNAVQETLVTTRNGRYVIPIKAELKGQVKGIVHDQSSSGATLFIEPLAVTELNNQWHQLQLDERDEVDRILHELSAAIGQQAAAILSTVEALAAVDLGLAKARYGALLRATTPGLNDDGRINLAGARHPLLTGRVVPIDVSLGDEFQILLITGPNTGGKTVALKTVGLLTLMAQCGLLVPTAEGSEVAIFDALYADIGDEQSIEQNLSTFSSHLTNIISMLRGLGDNTLLLLDDLGAGTDPTEGSALARAILSYLLERDVRVIATTHYSELKAFAYNEPGVENASVEFDVETLSPTYRLSIGLPGRSNALAIANRLGLDEHIIERGREFLGSAGVRMENLLEGLQSERKAVEDERFHLSMERAEAEYQRKQLEEERLQLEEQRVEILNEARTQAQRALDEVQAELSKIKGEAKRRNVTRERLGEARQRVHNLEDKVAPLPKPRRPGKKADSDRESTLAADQ